MEENRRKKNNKVAWGISRELSLEPKGTRGPSRGLLKKNDQRTITQSITSSHPPRASLHIPHSISSSHHPQHPFILPPTTSLHLITQSIILSHHPQHPFIPPLTASFLSPTASLSSLTASISSPTASLSSLTASLSSHYPKHPIISVVLPHRHLQVYQSILSLPSSLLFISS